VTKELESQADESTHAYSMSRAVYHLSYIAPLIVTVIMLSWPWIVFGVVWGRDGIAGGPRFSKLVRENPQTVTFLVTHIGTLFAAISALLFSTAVIRFSQKWIVGRNEVDIFHIAFFTTLRHQRFPWTYEDLATLVRRWHLVLTVLSCIFAFNFVPSGISALLGPIPFNKTASLTGTELDFSSSVPDCVAWLRIPRINGNCTWFVSEESSTASPS
jgi:hypothetical protein